MLRQYVFAFEKGRPWEIKSLYFISCQTEQQRHKDTTPGSLTKRRQNGNQTRARVGSDDIHACPGPGTLITHGLGSGNWLLWQKSIKVYLDASSSSINTFPYHVLCMCTCVPVCLSVSMWNITFVICSFCFVRGHQGYTEDHLGCHCSEANHLILEGSLTNMELSDSRRLTPQRTPKILYLPSTGILSRWHYTWLFTWVLGSNLGPYVFRQALHCWVISSPVSVFWDKVCLS